jgi:hypothetical protein
MPLAAHSDALAAITNWTHLEYDCIILLILAGSHFGLLLADRSAGKQQQLRARRGASEVLSGNYGCAKH